VIKFNIKPSGPQVLYPRSPLPAITDQVDIDGRSQPGYVSGGDPMIVLDGLYAGANAEGLEISGGHTTVRALNIRRFSGDGIVLEGSGFHTVVACAIGTDRLSMAGVGNHLSGIAVFSRNNTIGQAGLGNVISGNGLVGVYLYGSSA